MEWMTVVVKKKTVHTNCTDWVLRMAVLLNDFYFQF